MNPSRLVELVAEFGSPLYVYDLTEVRRARAELAAALPAGAEILYSLKANPHPALVAELVRGGCGAEVSSPTELRIALAAGAPAARCLYTGPGKTADEIAAAVAAGVRWFSADSPRDIARIGAAGRTVGDRCHVLLRVNPPTGAASGGLSMTGEASPFGADLNWIADRPGDFRHRDVHFAGIHVFLASNLESVDALVGAAGVALAAVDRLAPVLRDELAGDLEVIDLGGGFGHPFARPGGRPDLRDLVQPLDRLLTRHRSASATGARIVFESGRFLVGGCGQLVTTVQDVKVSQARSFAVLDSGIHHLGGMHGLRRLPFVGVEPLHRLRPAAGPGEVHDLVGPLCTPLDAWARQVAVGPLAPGDLVVVPNVGAYGLTASLLAFLGRDAPTEVVVDHEGEIVEAGRLVLVRQPAGDVVPAERSAS
jgi:diaminopimelate decarboxylase